MAENGPSLVDGIDYDLDPPTAVPEFTVDGFSDDEGRSMSRNILANEVYEISILWKRCATSLVRA